MTRSPQPGYESTFVASFACPSSGQVWYYIRARNETNFGTQGPLNSGNVWPVTDNFLAELAIELTGDTLNNPRGPYLDLTSVAMGRSGDYFYGRLTNNASSWPTRASIVGPWFLYTVGFRNADAYAGDTFAYAMTYADAPFGYGSGLYEINAYTEDFERIGNIDVATSGNRLVMRCRVTDLTSRRGFQPWPNTGGFLCSAKGETRSADISLNSWRHDSTNSSRFFVDRTPVFTVGVNREPQLSQPRVFPRFGDSQTSFQFTVNYADADSNLPVLCAVVVDSDTFRLRPNHHRYYEQVSFNTARAGFGPGTHRFHFAFSDGMAVVESAEDSFVIEGGTAIAEQPSEPTVAGFEAKPNPFRNIVELRGRLRSRVIEVFDHCGRFVTRLQQAHDEAVLRWDGTDELGRNLPGGVYFCREPGGNLRRLLVKLGQ